MSDVLNYYGTGRRKTATARVYLRPGSGAVEVNGRDLEGYFPSDVLRMVVRQPLVLTETVEKFDIVGERRGRRLRRPGRRDPARHQPRPARVQRRAARAPQGGRLPDPRPAQEGTQEVRPRGRPQAVPVQQALRRGVVVEISMKELLEAGVHFGHQTRRWNPKMKPYIFGKRNGIYIIDLAKTLQACSARPPSSSSSWGARAGGCCSSAPSGRPRKRSPRRRAAAASSGSPTAGWAAR